MSNSLSSKFFKSKYALKLRDYLAFRLTFTTNYKKHNLKHKILLKLLLNLLLNFIKLKHEYFMF